MRERVAEFKVVRHSTDFVAHFKKGERGSSALSDSEWNISKRDVREKHGKAKVEAFLESGGGVGSTVRVRVCFHGERKLITDTLTHLHAASKGPDAIYSIVVGRVTVLMDQLIDISNAS